LSVAWADEPKLGQVKTAQTKAASARQEEQLNPRLDGWETEAFSATAQEKLNELGTLLCDPARVRRCREFLQENEIGHLRAPGFFLVEVLLLFPGF
jgi:hypothetical protein